MIKIPLFRRKIIFSMILVLILLPFAGSASTWSTPCCPNIYVRPVYDYYGNQIWPLEGYDPYYMFPVYCSCPFLNDALNRTWQYQFADIYITKTSTSSLLSPCSTCSGVSQSVTYISETTNFPSQSQMIASITKSTGYTPKIPSVF